MPEKFFNFLLTYHSNGVKLCPMCLNQANYEIEYILQRPGEMLSLGVLFMEIEPIEGSIFLYGAGDR